MNQDTTLSASSTSQQVIEQSPAPRYCMKCYYSLAGLTEYRCPECGRAFDPADNRTWNTLEQCTPVRSRTMVVLLTLPMLLSSIGVFLLAALLGGGVVVLGYQALFAFLGFIMAATLRREESRAWRVAGKVLMCGYVMLLVLTSVGVIWHALG